MRLGYMACSFLRTAFSSYRQSGTNGAVEPEAERPAPAHHPAPPSRHPERGAASLIYSDPVRFDPAIGHSAPGEDVWPLLYRAGGHHRVEQRNCRPMGRSNRPWFRTGEVEE